MLSKAKVKLFVLASRFKRRFLPAFKPSVSPAAIAVPSDSLVLVSPVTLSSESFAMVNHLALLTAFTTVSTVASLPESVFDGSSESL